MPQTRIIRYGVLVAVVLSLFVYLYSFSGLREGVEVPSDSSSKLDEKIFKTDQLIVATGQTTQYLVQQNGNRNNTPQHKAQLQDHGSNKIPRYLIEQQDRNNTIHKICGPKKPLTDLTETEKMVLLRQIIVDDTHKLLYCIVPKVACTNWKRVLQVLSGKYAHVEDISKVDDSSFKLLLGYSQDGIEYRLNNYFKFMFVRHPLDRLFSAWNNKVHGNFSGIHKRYGISIVKNFRKNPPANPKGDDVSLGEFFKYLASTPISELNIHWMPYIELCQPCHIEYNYVGTYENLKNEAALLIKHIGLSEKVNFPSRQSHYYRNSASNETKLNEWNKVSPEAFQAVVKKYATDFKLFGYHIPESIDNYITEQIKGPS